MFKGWSDGSMIKASTGLLKAQSIILSIHTGCLTTDGNSSSRASALTCTYHTQTERIKIGAGEMVKSMGCSSRGPRLHSQHPHVVQTQLWLRPQGNPVPSSVLGNACMHLVDRHRPRQNSQTYKIQITCVKRKRTLRLILRLDLARSAKQLNVGSKRGIETETQGFGFLVNQSGDPVICRYRNKRGGLDFCQRRNSKFYWAYVKFKLSIINPSEEIVS